MATFAAGWIAAAVPARAQERVTIAVPLAPSAAPYLAAIENGYFRDAGLEVEIFYASGAVATESLASGAVQYSASPFPAIDAALRGANIRVILVTRSRVPYRLWSFDPAIRTLADAVRRPISVTTRGRVQEVALRMTLETAGIARDTLSLKATPFERERLDAIRSGQEKLAVLSHGDEPGIAGRMVADFSRDAEIAVEGLATSGAELAAHRDRAKRVLRAAHRGEDWVVANEDAAIRLLRRDMPSESPQDLAREISAAAQERNIQGVLPPEMIAREVRSRAEMLGVSAPGPENVYDFSLIGELRSEGRW